MNMKRAIAALLVLVLLSTGCALAESVITTGAE